jgi:hypothetical protein
MDTSIEDIAGLVRDLNFAEDGPQHYGQEPFRSKCKHPASLEEAIQVLIQSTNANISQAQCVKSLADDANSSSKLSVTEIYSLREASEKLTDVVFNLETTIDAVREATERSAIIQLRFLGSQSTADTSGRPPVQGLLSHFDKKIKDIIREVFNNTTTDQDMLWKIAEECYKQATSPTGVLHPDNYLIPLEEACLEWPYDPDFESEEYYDHENYLNVDEDYAAAFQEETELRSETLSKERQSWINIWSEFWIRVLNNSPAGPTLFHPPSNFSIESLKFDAVPEYLFRTFDNLSPGRNDESVIASIASINGSLKSSRTDILTLGQHRATEMLFKHLKKENVLVKEESDNLMSWTSSFLFAIQYAIWRLRFRQPESDIKICAIRTRDFPLGQFMQDISLLRAYHATANQTDPLTKSFFDFRLGKEDYYNGEYLSQGAVNHSNRSCVVSLKQLKQAGLFQLYPEFRVDSNQWTNRVLELRKSWSVEHGTTDREIKLALAVAHDCFHQFEPLDMAFLLLSFKNRTFSRVTCTSE